MRKERYFLKRNDEEEKEVSQQEFINAERASGFHPKSGDGPATGGFSNSRTGWNGRTEYVPEED